MAYCCDVAAHGGYCMCSEPTSRGEYERRFAKNHRVSGYGVGGTTVHMPCPFCAAADFIVHLVVESREAFERGGVCRDCGRGARAIYTDSPCGSKTAIRFVQTDGDPPSPWVQPMERVDE